MLNYRIIYKVIGTLLYIEAVMMMWCMGTPDDRIVWDVGHQAYGHKILTGRRDRFCTNRKLHGIMPFPSPKESEYDTFT